MPAPDCYETHLSQRLAQQYASGALSREYIVRFTSDPIEARDLIATTSPVSYKGLERKSIIPEPFGAPDLWSGIVEYGAGAPQGGMRPDQFSMKVGAASAHITQGEYNLYRLKAGDSPPFGINLTVDGADPALVTPGIATGAGQVGQSVVITGGPGFVPGSYEIFGAPGGTQWQLGVAVAPAGTAGGIWHLSGSAPDCKGAIGWSLDTVEGCDTIVPRVELAFSARRELVNAAWVQVVRSLVGKTNDKPFKGYPTGTLRYLGCEPTSPAGTLGAVEALGAFVQWNFSHAFLYEEDVTNVLIGNILVPRKPGHAYLWAKYQPVVAGGGLPMQPIGIYVDVVAKPGNFDLLEIP